MNSPDSIPCAESTGCSKWYWPIRPLTFFIGAAVVGVAFLANFPAVKVPRAGMSPGKYGPHFEIQTEFQHGWPARYARRDSFQPSNPTVPLMPWIPASPWKPWDRLLAFMPLGLGVNFLTWVAAIFLGGIVAQYWRSHRRAIWSWTIRDLLVATLAAGLVLAWIAAQRSDSAREVRLLETYSVIFGITFHASEPECSVPMFLPSGLQDHYRNHMQRVLECSSNGRSDVACEFRHLLTYSESHPSPDFATHLAKMPQLEGLDLCMTNLTPVEDPEPRTLLRDLPPMPKLRGLNLYDTGVTDADLVWLSKCPRLECVELTSTDISDEGLVHLSSLSKLRSLSVTSERISDQGCKTLGRMSSLEEIHLSSSKITDSGVMELARLKNLQLLQIETSASTDTIKKLQIELPKCAIQASESMF